MSQICNSCGKIGVLEYTPFSGARLLCADCARKDVLENLAALDIESQKRLRRRIEDKIRKSPADFFDVAVMFILKGKVTCDDLMLKSK
ncbi:MAG: hypothetical protein ACLFNW_08880 [Desulfobacterales bacterium]